MFEVKIIEGFKLTSKYGYRKHPTEKVYMFHGGIDFVGDNTMLLAIAGGKIIEVDKDSISGNYIKVEYIIDGVNYVFSYCHLNTHTPKAMNKTVVTGEWIAELGSSGRSTGPHCHLTVRRNGVIVDPQLYFKFI